MKQIKQGSKMIQSIFLGVILLMLGVIWNNMSVLATVETEEAPKQGVHGDVPWRIEGVRPNVTLYIGGGTFGDSTGLEDTDVASWRNYKNEITRIIFEDSVIANVNSSGLFFDMQATRVIEGIEKLDTSNVTNMRGMFSSMVFVEELDLSNFDTSKVEDMSTMFAGCRSLTNLNVTSFDTSNVTNMSSMFGGMSRLVRLDVSGFDTAKVEDMATMFGDSPQLMELDVTGFDTSKVKNMSRMFAGQGRRTTLDLTGFDTSEVTGMAEMFDGVAGIANLDISHFNTSKVEDMSAMFRGMSNLTNLNRGEFDTSNVENMSEMFRNVSKMTSLDVSSFNTMKVIDMNRMFNGMSALTRLDISGFDTSQVSNMSNMLAGMPQLTQLVLGEDFQFSSTAGLSDGPNAPGKWRDLGMGDVDDPLGDNIFTSSEFMQEYVSSMAGLFVWQTDLQALRLKTDVLIFGEGDASASKVSEVRYGEEVTLTATRTGDEIFKGWLVVEGNVTLSSTTDLVVTFENTGEDVKVYAVFGLVNGSLWGEWLYTSDDMTLGLSDVIRWGEDGTLNDKIKERADVRRYDVLGGSGYEQYGTVFFSQIAAQAGVRLVGFRIDSDINSLAVTFSHITIVDDIAPVITAANSLVTTETGSARPTSWTEVFGVIAIDETDDDITADIRYNVDIADIDMDIEAIHEIIATVSDEAGNTITKQLTFVIEESEEPGTGEPEEPGTGEPEEPGTGEPEEPGTGEPEEPGTGEPEEPGTGEPEEPGTGEPEEPGTGEPEEPGTGEPEEPGTGEPEEPGTGEPEEPGTGEPEEPGTGSPEEPGTGSPEEPGTGSPEEPGTGGSEEPGTGSPEEPGTGSPEEPGTGGSEEPGTGGSEEPGTGGSEDPGAGSSEEPGTGGSDEPGTGSSEEPGTGGSEEPGTGDSEEPGTGGSEDPGTGGSKEPGTGNPGAPGTGDSDSNVGKGGLQAAVDRIVGENLKELEYTSDSWKALQDAIINAQKVLDNQNATQAEINAALQAVLNARNNLVKVAPRLPIGPNLLTGQGSSRGSMALIKGIPVTDDVTNIVMLSMLILFSSGLVTILIVCKKRAKQK